MGHISNANNFKPVKSLPLENGDKVAMGNYVIAQLPSIKHIAQVAEIIQHCNRWLVVLVKVLNAGPEASVHGMPQLTTQTPTVYMPLPPEKILCVVNIQHDCVRNKCTVQQTIVVCQEQQDTELRKGQVVH
uniref:Uncharacterized protein n=1 Tax=Moniliophthora roreri TaxID=221103 RepID=A0A0W0FLX5_MONRR